MNLLKNIRKGLEDMNIFEKKVGVIGLGYIGLPTSLALAANGIDVVGVDIKEEIVNSLKEGRVTFEEAGLDELYAKAVAKKMVFSTEYPVADIYVVTMPTPYDEVSKKVDASYIVRATECVLDIMPKGAVVVIESTVSPGTIDEHVRPLFAKHGFTLGVDAHLAHAPERIIPGNMIYELEHNARTVGADEPEIGDLVRDLYGSFCKGEIVTTDIRTAEMTKVVENTFRSINIAYANELAKLCRMKGMDVREVIRIANKHPRVNILSPGPGVGGHCISVDPWFLVGDFGELAELTFSAVKVNASMPEYVLGRISEIMEANGITDNSRVGLYGLTYKEDVDDTRESPTLQLLDCMKKHLASGVKVYDPFVKTKIVDGQVFDLDEFVGSVDLVVILVGHSEIKQNLAKLEGKLVLDTRNVCPTAQERL